MGNRAVITSSDREIGVYMHWHGGLDSVTGLCDACRKLKYHDPTINPSYALARFTSLAALLMCGDGLSVGVGPLNELDCDNGDNGVYVIGRNWKIVQRYGDGSKPLRPLTPGERETADAVRRNVMAKIGLARGHDLLPADPDMPDAG